MIRDLNRTDVQDPPQYDLCIIGSGPAGATVARELASSGLSICVLESGREKTTRHADRLREVESAGISIKDYSRERVLGGASTTWAGLSSPLDRVDLGRRPYLRYSGWPIDPDELPALYAEAAERYRFPGDVSFGPEGFAALRDQGEMSPTWKDLEEKVFLAASSAQNFGRESHAIYENDVDVYLDATVIRLDGGGARGSVSWARVRTTDGREVKLQARIFVVATGGIENARLLLKSTDLCGNGLGNENDQVGRYFMNHPKNYHGLIHLNSPVRNVPYYFGCLYRGFAGYAGIRLCERVQEEQELLNSYIRLEPLFPWSDSEGVGSLVLLVKRSRFIYENWRATREGGVVTLRDYSETGDDSDLQNERKSLLGWLGVGANVVLHAPSVLRYLYSRLSSGQAPPVREVRLRNFMEMEPDPDNRVELGDGKDLYGEPLARVTHHPTDRDRRSLLVLHETLKREVESAGVGEMQSNLEGEDPWPIDEDASHHMGTTRMGDDPLTSVVDPSLKIHGIENVYLAGGSVFPTSGCANPTFTIVALSIRLAREIKRQLQGR